MKINKVFSIRLIVFISAFNGMLSEFLLGHLLSLSWGSVYKQYALTMGLFVLSMGIGAWKFKSSENPARTLKRILFLSALALLMALFTTWVSVEHYKSEAILILQMLLIIGIGFFAGAELPLLEKIHQQGHPSASVPHVLVWDYLGMAFGSLFFGFYLLQAWGVFGTLWVLLLLHSFLILWALRYDHIKGSSQ